MLLTFETLKCVILNTSFRLMNSMEDMCETTSKKKLPMGTNSNIMIYDVLKGVFEYYSGESDTSRRRQLQVH